MSGTFAEKLLTIAENTPKVFEVGKKGIEADIAPIKIVSPVFQEKLQMIADNVIRVYEAGRDSGGLGDEYQQVEYIESTGTQYIVTDYIPNNNTRTVCDFQVVTPSATFIFGVRKTTSTLAWTLNQSSGSSPVWYTSYNNSGNTNLGKLDTQRHIVDKNKNEIYIDGVFKHTFTEEEFTCEKPLSIFACNFNGVAGYGCSSIKLFSFKIYDNDVLVRDYIPCYRKADNVAGLYDLVNKTFLENSGSDSFILPSDSNIVPTDFQDGIYTCSGYVGETVNVSCALEAYIEYTVSFDYEFVSLESDYGYDNLAFAVSNGYAHKYYSADTNKGTMAVTFYFIKDVDELPVTLISPNYAAEAEISITNFQIIRGAEITTTATTTE